MPSYKLIYFDSRARGEVARFLFILADVEYQDVRLEYGGAEWLAMKPKTPLGQLPILEVDGKKLVQSKAIFRYLAKEFGFYGKDNLECALIDAVMDTCEQLHTPVVPLFSAEGAQKEELLQNYKKEVIKTVLNGLESFFQSGNVFFLGDKLTVADLIAYCDIELASIVADVPLDDLLKDYPKLLAMRTLVDSNEKITSWIQRRPKTFL